MNENHSFAHFSNAGKQLLKTKNCCYLTLFQDFIPTEYSPHINSSSAKSQGFEAPINQNFSTINGNKLAKITNQGLDECIGAHGEISLDKHRINPQPLNFISTTTTNFQELTKAHTLTDSIEPCRIQRFLQSTFRKLTNLSLKVYKTYTIMNTIGHYEIR